MVSCVCRDRITIDVGIWRANAPSRSAATSRFSKGSDIAGNRDAIADI